MPKRTGPTHPPRQLERRRFLRAAAAAPMLAAGLDARAEQDAGFEPLFDGVSLEGWHTNREKSAHGKGGRWRVKEGVLEGEQEPPGSGNGGLLLTDGVFGDFELIIGLAPDWGPDSGVFVRCNEQGHGFQMYVDYYDGGNVGHLRGEMPGAFAMKPFQIVSERDEQGRIAGFTTRPDPRALEWPEGVYAYSCAPEAWCNAWRIDAWNTARIRCEGISPVITTWINDVKICCFDGASSAMPGYDKERVRALLGREGRIGLQVHGGKHWPEGQHCRWRHIRIKPL